eukprot:95650-Pleurochrysis_carterae.AAC.1
MCTRIGVRARFESTTLPNILSSRFARVPSKNDGSSCAPLLRFARAPAADGRNEAAAARRS